MAGAAIVLRVDGRPVAETSADDSGQFVALFMLAPSDAVQVMTLEMLLADGRNRVSDDRVVLSPRPEAALALAEPEAEAEAGPAPLALAAVRAGAEPAAGSRADLPVLPAAQVRQPDLADAVTVLEGVDVAVSVGEGPQVAIGAAPEPVEAADTAEPEMADTGEAAPVMAAPEPAAEASPQVLSAARETEAEPAIEEAPLVGQAPAILEAPEIAEGPAIAESPAVAGKPDPSDAPQTAAMPQPPETVDTALATEIFTTSEAPDFADAPAVATTPPDPTPPTAERAVSEASFATPLPELPETAEEGSAPAAPLQTETTETIAVAESPLPRGFVLRGSGAVELLDPAPQVMDNVVVDVIAYSAEGDVQISGRAARSTPGGSVQVYLDNRPVASALAENGDWASDLPEVDPGVYVLRVDQISPEGQVISRFETPFQREDPAIVRAAQADAAASVREPAPAMAPASPPDPATDALSDAGSAAEPVLSTAQATGAQVEAAAAPGTDTPAAGPAPVALMTVQPGHSLWRIAEGQYGAGERYVMIYRANRSQIRNPDLIYPGQVFVLPED
ncbi:MAG: LysM peptidoglycan-binding domain-containing protein [Pararhodobacter sp.]|nr:LysM peptidoglycan-binding domain-containing protein [Pararhodobacter sp.]